MPDKDQGAATDPAPAQGVIDRVQAVSVPVSDQDRAKAFYADLLGFEVVADDNQANGLRWVQLRPKGAQTSIVLATWHPMPPGSLKGLLLHTRDLGALRARLIERRHAAPDITEAPWARFFKLDDPDGNGLVIQQRPEG